MIKDYTYMVSGNPEDVDLSGRHYFDCCYGLGRELRQCFKKAPGTIKVVPGDKHSKSPISQTYTLYMDNVRGKGVTDTIYVVIGNASRWAEERIKLNAVGTVRNF